MTAAVEQLRALVAQGRWQKARARYQRLGKKAQNDVEALFLVGIAYGQLKEYEAALDSFQRVIALNPSMPAVYQNMGLALKELGRPQDAITAFRKAVQLKPDFIDAWCGLGLVCSSIRQYSGAEECFRKALAVRPDNMTVQYHLAQTLRALQRHQEAFEIFSHLVNASPDSIELYEIIGNNFSEAGRYDEALQWYQRAIDIKPDFASVYYNLGLTYQTLGDLDNAVKYHRLATKYDVDNYQAHRAIAANKVFTDVHDPDLSALEKAMQSGNQSAEGSMHLHFALAKAYEDLADYDRAFRHYRDANRIKRSEYDYNINMDVALIDRIKASLSKDILGRHAAGLNLEGGQVPVFIVGMPRSGTSLVEQILASHPDVYGAGELATLKDTLSQLPGLAPILSANANGTAHDVRATLAHLADGDLSRLAAQYQQLAGANSGAARFVTDKLPMNFLHIGLIYLLMPQARVIHCMRDPLDTCLSCYKRYFTGELRFAYDLTELGQYYCLYQDLMAYWHEVLPGFVFELSYEDLVTNQEATTRRLLEFVGLDWDSRCLTFYATDRSVKTNSFAQVRKPIYQSAMKLWTHYASHLAPLMDELRRCGNDVSR